LSAAAPRRFEAGVCKQTSGGHLPSFRAAPTNPLARVLVRVATITHNFLSICSKLQIIVASDYRR
jgi:hypothetical protein